MGQRPPLHFDHARADRKFTRYIFGQRVVVRARALDPHDFGGVTGTRIRPLARDRQRDAVAGIGVRRRCRGLVRPAVVNERRVRPADRKFERRDREGEFFLCRRRSVGVRIVRPLVVAAVPKGQRNGVCIRIHPIAALRDIVQVILRNVGGLRRAVVSLAAKRGDVDRLLGDRPFKRLVPGRPVVRPHEVGGIAEGGGDGVRPRILRRQLTARKIGGRAARDRKLDGRRDRKPFGGRPVFERDRLLAAAVCIAGVGEGRRGDLQFGDRVGDRQGAAFDLIAFAADVLAPNRFVSVDLKRRRIFARGGAALIRDDEILRIILPRVGHGGGLPYARISERGKRRRTQHALADRERGELFVLHRREVAARRDADGERVSPRLVGKVGFRPRA